jgi:uncharacterized protein (TIGR00251 family)
LHHSCTESPLSAVADGVRVRVHLTPNARADRLEGTARLADGAAVVKASVGAPPADGRANDALLRLLAKEWALPRHDLAIAAGAKSRRKTVHIAGAPAELLKRLDAALAALAKS